ncbi:transcription termination/antitermination protein NusA [Candidatus Parcubacteria bacterium]|nr:transcription termination/antitermination protein NusA [Candidatus Parcubacteria bacterium]
MIRESLDERTLAEQTRPRKITFMFHDHKQFIAALEQIADEKGISRERVLATIELAIAAAYKKDYGKKGQVIRAKLDPATGTILVKQVKLVVDEAMLKPAEEIEAEDEMRSETLSEEFLSEAARARRAAQESEDETLGEVGEKKIRFNAEKHIMVADAKVLDPALEAGTELEIPLEPHESFGRIAAQTAKQVIIQRIREAEREAVYSEYKDKEGEVVSGVVQRVDGRNVFLDIGKAVGILPASEQIPSERYHVGERLKVYVLAVEKETRGAGLVLSRAHPKLIEKLFEMEVPEVASGAVEIKATAREAGARSKIAVASHEEGVDPVGSCVGQKGTRVSTVINELSGEKIDIIQWSADSDQFIAQALSPAKVSEVVVDEVEHRATVVVPEEQLSLAIGKRGQNVRLAAKLTGWKIDIRGTGGTVPPVESAAAPGEGSALPPADGDASTAEEAGGTLPPADSAAAPVAEGDSPPPAANAEEVEASPEVDEPKAQPAGPAEPEPTSTAQ